jgi:hypothetical protein
VNINRLVLTGEERRSRRAKSASGLTPASTTYMYKSGMISRPSMRSTTWGRAGGTVERRSLPYALRCDQREGAVPRTKRDAAARVRQGTYHRQNISITLMWCTSAADLVVRAAWECTQHATCVSPAPAPTAAPPPAGPCEKRGARREEGGERREERGERRAERGERREERERRSRITHAL